MYLPKSEATASVETLSARRREATGGDETILLVEDHDDVRRIVATALERLGYKVHEAADGTTALALLEHGLEPDLLFTDLLLPDGMNGIAVAREVSNRCPGASTLLTSGADDTLLKQNPAGLNMRILAKPYSMSDLAIQVRAALDGT